MKYLLRSTANFHRPGADPDIFLFATPRGGSTWLMEIIASQPRMKFYDEPLSPRRENVAMSGVIPDWKTLMPDSGRADLIVSFLRDLQAGRHGYMNPPPFRRHHRLLTNRIIFKVHEIEHLMSEVERACSAKVVYLLRHPIATSISRHQLPRLDLFLTCSYHAAILGDAVVSAEIAALAARADFFQRAIISWCFENLVALKRPQASWLYATYEELVLNPEQSCQMLTEKLNLTDRRAMLDAFDRPAANIKMSHEQTLAALRSPDARRRRHRLVTKWQDKISGEQLTQAQAILDLFGIDAYSAWHALPAAPYLHFADTTGIFEQGDRLGPGQ